MHPVAWLVLLVAGVAVLLTVTAVLFSYYGPPPPRVVNGGGAGQTPAGTDHKTPAGGKPGHTTDPTHPSHSGTTTTHPTQLARYRAVQELTVEPATVLGVTEELQHDDQVVAWGSGTEGKFSLVYRARLAGPHIVRRCLCYSCKAHQLSVVPPTYHDVLFTAQGGYMQFSGTPVADQLHVGADLTVGVVTPQFVVSNLPKKIRSVVQYSQANVVLAPEDRLYDWALAPLTAKTLVVAALDHVYAVQNATQLDAETGQLDGADHAPKISAQTVGVEAARAVTVAEVVTSDTDFTRTQLVVFVAGVSPQGQNAVSVLTLGNPLSFTGDQRSQFAVLKTDAFPLTSGALTAEGWAQNGQLRSSTDGTRVALRAQDRVFLYRQAQGEQTWYQHRELNVPGVTQIALSHDGEVLVWLTSTQPDELVVTSFEAPLHGALQRTTLKADQPGTDQGIASFDVLRVHVARYCVLAKYRGANQYVAWLVQTA